MSRANELARKAYKTRRVARPIEYVERQFEVQYQQPTTEGEALQTSIDVLSRMGFAISRCQVIHREPRTAFVTISIDERWMNNRQAFNYYSEGIGIREQERTIDSGRGSR